LGRRPLGAVLHSSNESGELSQWLCHDDSTINIVLGIIILLDYTRLRRARLCRDMTRLRRFAAGSQGRGFAAWPAALPRRPRLRHARLCRDVVCRGHTRGCVRTTINIRIIIKVTPLFDAEYLRNGQWNTRDLNMPSLRVSFRVSLGDLAKYSMTRRIACMVSLRQLSVLFLYGHYSVERRFSVLLFVSCKICCYIRVMDILHFARFDPAHNTRTYRRVRELAAHWEKWVSAERL